MTTFGDGTLAKTGKGKKSGKLSASDPHPNPLLQVIAKSVQQSAGEVDDENQGELEYL